MSEKHSTLNTFLSRKDFFPSKIKNNTSRYTQTDNPQQRHMVKTFHQYKIWKQKRGLCIPLQQRKHDDKYPILNIAINCGNKNGVNQVLQQYTRPLIKNQYKSSMDNINSFQKILAKHQNTKISFDSKRLTFVNFKTKNQKDNFLTSSQIKEKRQQKKRSRTQPSGTFTISFRNTGYPKQLAELKQQIEELPVLKQCPKRKLPTQSTYLEEINPSLVTQNYSMVQTQVKDLQQTNKQNKLFKQSKSVCIKNYISSFNEVINYADFVIQEEMKFKCQAQSIKGEIQDRNRDKNQPKIALYRKYWPQFRRYSLKVRENNEGDICSFFSSYSNSDSELDNQVHSLVSTIKTDLNKQQIEMNKEIALSQKNSIETRFKYKMNIEKDNYKRNVKSYLKCKKLYRIQKKRQQVRANGIKRSKKSNVMPVAMRLKLNELKQSLT